MKFQFLREIPKTGVLEIFQGEAGGLLQRSIVIGCKGIGCRCALRFFLPETPPEIRGINQKLLSEKGNLWPDLSSLSYVMWQSFLSCV